MAFSHWSELEAEPRGGQKVKVTLNVLKHILVLDFLKSDEIEKMCNCPLVSQ